MKEKRKVTYWESKYRTLRAATLELNAERRRAEKVAEKDRQRLRALLWAGMSTDGAHHKQWYLNLIADLFCVVLPPGGDKGIAP